MSLISIDVPREYGYVLTATATTFFVSLFHGIYGASFRKAAGIKVPQTYAEQSNFAAAADDPHKKKALYLLNCAQRAHANYLEVHPSVALSMLIAGVQYPIATAAMGSAWTVARIIYTLGYTSKTRENGRGRELGFLLALPIQTGLFGMAAWTGLKMVL